jgi:hypothetical protein
VGGVELLGVERPAEPVQQFGMLGMARSSDDVEQVLVAGRAAAVLRRAGAGAVEAGRRLGGPVVLDADVVLPAVAEVVVVAEDGAVGDGADGDRPWIAEVVQVIDVPVADAVELEQPQMGVLPAHGGLEQAMQVGQSGALGNDDAPPHRRVDVPEADGELDGGHALDRCGRFLVEQRGTGEGHRGRRRWCVAVPPGAEDAEPGEDHPGGVADGEERRRAVEGPTRTRDPAERGQALGHGVLGVPAASGDREQPEQPGDAVGLIARQG